MELTAFFPVQLSFFSCGVSQYLIPPLYHFGYINSIEEKVLSLKQVRVRPSNNNVYTS